MGLFDESLLWHARRGRASGPNLKNKTARRRLASMSGVVRLRSQRRPRDVPPRHSASAWERSSPRRPAERRRLCS
jgi:hypothetical protein